MPFTADADRADEIARAAQAKRERYYTLVLFVVIAYMTLRLIDIYWIVVGIASALILLAAFVLDLVEKRRASK